MTEMETAQVEAFLTRFRDDRGRPVQSMEVLEIGIPDSYRSRETFGAAPRVLDLPGAEAKNSVERDHAARLVQHFVPAAQMVILVAKAHQITSLFAGLASRMPQLAAWSSVPERFRIVLTHTVSSDSVQRAAGRLDGPPTVRWLRDHVLRQLLNSDESWQIRDDPELQQRVAASLFPLEYGASWRGLAARSPLSVERFGPLIDELLQELLARVADQAVEDARRISLVHATRTLELAAARHARELEVAVEASQRLESTRARELKAARKKDKQARDTVEVARELAAARRRAEENQFERTLNGRRRSSASGDQARVSGDRNAAVLEEKWNARVGGMEELW